MQRLREMDTKLARQLTGVLVTVFAFGLAVLFAVSPPGPNGYPQPESGASTVLSFGVALASYILQRNAFRAWRLSHQEARTSPWLGAFGIALLYAIPVYVAAALLYLGGEAVQT
jgi:hypothetical protein